MRSIFCSFIFVILTKSAYCQFRKVEQDFVRYLLNSKQYEEAVIILEEKLHFAEQESERDSLYFSLGKTYYSLQKLEEACKFFDKVSSSDENLKSASIFLYAYSNAYLHRFAEAQRALMTLSTSTNSFEFLKTFELAGLSLLLKDFEKFDSLSTHFDPHRMEVQERQENFLKYRKDISKLKRKSPFVAATLSGIVPGLGRIYAGKKATGIYSFIAGTLLGLQVYEGYRKDGVKSARFIFYGTLFSTFYIGNIWGSALSVKVARDEKQEAIQHQVLVDMHIPIRTIFQ